MFHVKNKLYQWRSKSNPPAYIIVLKIDNFKTTTLTLTPKPNPNFTR